MKTVATTTWSDLALRTPALVARRGLTATSRPLEPGFARREGKGGLELEARAWAIGGGDDGSQPTGEARLVSIRGPRVEVLNAMIFPARPDALGVFAAELLGFGDTTWLGFVDVQGPGQGEPARAATLSLTAPLRRSFESALAPETLVPSWAVESSPGGFYFTRTRSPEAVDVLALAYEKYLEAWLELAAKAVPGPGAPLALDALQAYKAHHVASSPGTAFLGRQFGSEWTLGFLSRFLYS